MGYKHNLFLDRFQIIFFLVLHPDTNITQMHKLSVASIIIVITILIGLFFVVNNLVVAQKPTISLKDAITKTLTIPDTVYSDTVKSNVILNGNAVQGAHISYTLIDTVNNTQLLIREAITNAAGQDIVDSLPVLKHYTGIGDIKPDAYTGMVITNNGTGSNHLIRFSTDAKSVSKEGHIINMLGQQITTIHVKYNSNTQTYDAVWKGEKIDKGMYIFHTASTNGAIATKIDHEENIPSSINYGAKIKKQEPQEEENSNKSIKATEELAVSKYAIAITHESLEDLLDTVHVQENTMHDFFFNAVGIQYSDGNIFGNIFFTEGGNSPTNANVEYKQFNNQSNVFNTTAPSGMYNLQVPVVYEPLNPGQTKYIITLTENGDPFETLTDTLLVSPGVNNFTHYVVQITEPPIDTVYSDIVTSNVFLDGNPFEGANISYTLLDSITGNQELIREAITNASGQDIVDSLPVLAAETGLGMSKYIINITHDNLEDLIDTVRVQENTMHDFLFNVTGIQYADADVWGQIYFVETGLPPSDANVEYKRLLNQSEIFTTTAPNGVYNIQVPIVFEPTHPGETEYIITLTENGDPFETFIDTLLVASGTNGFTHYVNQTQTADPEQDFEGIVRNDYSKLPESGVTVRLIDRTSGTLLQEETTGADGLYFFSNIAQGTLVEFELGKPGELWMVNHEFDIPANIIDTLVTLNRYYYPEDVEVPELGANTIIQGDGEEISEIYGPDYIHFEEVLRDVDNMWDNGGTSDYWTTRTWIQDNIYQGISPITTVSTARNITSTMQNNYDPYTNFYSGQLGWNVNFGSGNSTTTTVSSWENHYAILGGEIMVTGPIAAHIKEMQYRRWYAGDVASPANGGRLSVMNASASMPDDKDRAYMYLTIINQNGRFDTDEESYSLENITSTAPTMRSNEGQNIYAKEKPLPAADYVDMPGTKPHSKRHFNQEKFDEQMQHKREEQVKSLIR